MKEKMKRLIVALLMVLTLCTVSACGKQPTVEEPITTEVPTATEALATETPTAEVTEPTDVATIGSADAPTATYVREEINTDRAGNAITLPDSIEKVMIAGPANAEILNGLGLADKIVAADSYSQGAEGVSDDILFFDMMAPDVEQLLSLAPDVLFATGMVQAGDDNVYQQLIDSGVCVIYIPTSTSIAGIEEDINYIATVMGQSEKGAEIVAKMENDIKTIREVGETITDKKSVYFELAAAPDMYSFGNGVFLNEMIEIIGATNIFVDQESWLSVTNESIVSANPDVILTCVNYIDNPIEEVKSRAGWDVITAVKDNAVYSIDTNASNNPSQNIVKALEEMAKAVYPDKY